MSNICAPPLNHIWNKEIIIVPKSFDTCVEKENSSLLKNYRTASVLLVVSKIRERIMQKQILIYVDKHLSPQLCGCRKGYSTETVIISMLEKWKLSINNKGFVGGVLLDLSKMFDTINHHLLLAKLHAYCL